MHLFTEYIEPLTLWLYTHPHWALFITFFISLSESLAVIGSIIPGSVTMTTIGILAGSGVMRIDLTFLAGILGAIAGDGGSYALGALFSDKLMTIWPFKKHPRWLAYGQDYFTRHGSYSVLIGRFVGPIRSIIPVIAGMMHMNHWHFLIANVLSAVAWSILYITPGVLIGAASSELSTESATHLFVLILVLLILVWLISIGVRWILVHAKQILYTRLHQDWLCLSKRPRLAQTIHFLTPPTETNHAKTAGLIVLSLVGLTLSICTLSLTAQGVGVATLNPLITCFFQSLRTQTFDTLFILLTLMISPLPLSLFTGGLILTTVYHQDWRTFRYLVSLVLITMVSIVFLAEAISTPCLPTLPKHLGPALCPAPTLTFTCSIVGFLLCYIRQQTIPTLLLKYVLISLLCLEGMALIYLGDNWFLNVIAAYEVGLTIALIHWVLYRRHGIKIAPHALLLAFFLLIASASMVTLHSFEKWRTLHKQPLLEYVISSKAWWNQRKPLFPLYSTNRLGQKIRLFNIQYLGSLPILKQTLEKSGWKQQPDSLLYSLFMRAGGQNSAEELPLMAQLYQNKKPTLVMIYPTKSGKSLFILRLWRSNYHVETPHLPLWLGSLIRLKVPHNTPTKPLHHYLTEALPTFQFKQRNLPHQHLPTRTHPDDPILLMITDPRVSF